MRVCDSETKAHSLQDGFYFLAALSQCITCSSPLRLCPPPPPDHHPDWPVEDSPPPTAGARGQETGPLLGVRRRRPLPAHVHLRPHRSLAGLHLVRSRRRDESDERGKCCGNKKCPCFCTSETKCVWSSLKILYSVDFHVGLFSSTGSQTKRQNSESNISI